MRTSGTATQLPEDKMRWWWWKRQIDHVDRENRRRADAEACQKQGRGWRTLTRNQLRLSGQQTWRGADEIECFQPDHSVRLRGDISSSKRTTCSSSGVHVTELVELRVTKLISAQLYDAGTFRAATSEELKKLAPVYVGRVFDRERSLYTIHESH